MKKKFSVFNIAVAIILILIVGIGAMILFVNPEHKTVSKTNTTMNDEPSKPAKPVFRKDGELRFLDGKTNNVISTINIEVADDDAEKEQGLMYRDTMAENNGMLFLMGVEEPQTFWMKNTILSLDIIFVDSDRKIVSIHKNCTPYSLDQIPSEKPALFVVEVNAGYTEKHTIKNGDRISF
jgi:uncharacterized protein